MVTNRATSTIFFIWLTCLCIIGCQSPSHRSAERPLPSLALPPASLGTTLQMHQKLSFTRLRPSSFLSSHPGEVGTSNATQEGSVEILLEADPNILRLAIVSFGQRLASIAFDGVSWEIQRSPRLPAALKAEDIVRDIQLTYWPASVIQAALPNEYRLLEIKNQRILLRGDIPVMQITYNSTSLEEQKVQADRYARIDLENFVYSYRLVIERAQ